MIQFYRNYVALSTEELFYHYKCTTSKDETKKIDIFVKEIKEVLIYNGAYKKKKDSAPNSDQSSSQKQGLPVVF